jgi:hypothetical protein
MYASKYSAEIKNVKGRNPNFRCMQRHYFVISLIFIALIQFSWWSRRNEAKHIATKLYYTKTPILFFEVTEYLNSIK